MLCALHENDLEKSWIEEVEKHCSKLETIRISRAQQFVNLALSVFGKDPFQVSYFFQKQAKRRIDQLLSDWKPDAIYCQLLRTAKYVDAIDNIPKVIDFQDAFSKGIERRLSTDPWYYKPILVSELKRLNEYEQSVFSSFNHCTIISEQDRDQLPFKQRDNVAIVRNGVDLDSFSPGKEEKTIDVLFAGNMGYPPNVEGAVFLHNEVMPLVRKRIPNAKLMLAGARPSQQVKDLADSDTIVTGWVDDIRDCYAQAKVFVAPMMIGTGLQNKLLEAMAMRIPCVTSKLANNALQAKEVEEILIADSAEEYAEFIVELLTDPNKAEALGNAGFELVSNHYSWNGATQPLLDLLNRAATS
jgi:glycosyltransferase involved in cell wall biosynthesis